jgi:hypothetical protein
MKSKSTDLAGGKVVTTINCIARGLTVLVLGLMTTGVIDKASGQERTELCQNNLNLIASLEQQLAPIPPYAIWSDEKLGAASSFLIRIQRNKAKVTEQVMTLDYKLVPSGDETLDEDLSRTLRKCMEQETLLFINYGDAGRSCLETVEAGLQRAIRDAIPIRSRVAEIQRKMQDCHTNLMALGCDQTGVTHDITASWNLVQGKYTGWLSLHQTGAVLTGFLYWSNHGGAGGIQDGTFENGKIHFKIAYPGGAAGLYDGIVSPSGKGMGGTASGELGGGSWSATRP